jgi:hypothetical protein
LNLSTVVLLCVVIVSVNAQSDFHSYPARTIDDLIQQHSAESSKGADLTVSADPFPSKTRLTYTGERRPLDQWKKHFINVWAQTRNLPPENAAMLVEEYLFKEKGKEYWIPVLKHLPPLLQEDLKPGVEFTAFYFFLGAYNEKTLREKTKVPTNEPNPVTVGNNIEWVFALEAYLKPAEAIVNQSLGAALSKNVESSQAKLDVFIDQRQVRSKSKLIFTGDVRKVAENKANFLKAWLESRALPPSAINLFQEEVRFREADKDYWCPVRRPILDSMRKELKPGDEITILTILAGGFSQAGSLEWVFIVGEYSK